MFSRRKCSNVFLVRVSKCHWTTRFVFYHAGFQEVLVVIMLSPINACDVPPGVSLNVCCTPHLHAFFSAYLYIFHCTATGCVSWVSGILDTLKLSPETPETSISKNLCRINLTQPLPQTRSHNFSPTRPSNTSTSHEFSLTHDMHQSDANRLCAPFPPTHIHTSSPTHDASNWHSSGGCVSQHINLTHTSLENANLTHPCYASIWHHSGLLS